MLAMRNNGSRTVYVPDRASKPYKCRFVLTRLLLFAGAGVSALSPLWAQLVVNTVAGGTIRSGVPAQDVAFRNITGIAADASGGVVVCEWPANVIRRIRPDGIIETIAGTGENGYSGDGGLAVNTAINWPVTPHFDGKGDLYFGDVLNRMV